MTDMAERASEELILECSQLIDASIDQWKDLHISQKPYWRDFLFDILLNDPAERSNLGKYECPSGPLANRVYVRLHHPPDDSESTDYSSIKSATMKRYNRSINLLLAIFPDFAQWTSFDQYCRKRPLNDIHGNRQSPDEMYGWDTNLNEHFNLSATLIDNLEPEEGAVLINVGSYARDWFVSTYGDSGEITAKNNKTIQLYHIPHPEWLKRYANARELLKVQENLEQISTKHGIRVSRHLNTYRVPSTSSPHEVPANYFEPSKRIADRVKEWIQRKTYCAANSRALVQAIHQQESEETKRRLSGKLRWDKKKTREIRVWFLSLSIEQRQKLFVKASDKDDPPSDEQVRSRIGHVYSLHYAPDSAERRARISERSLNAAAWTGDTPQDLVQAKRHDNTLHAWQPYRLSSAASSDYKTFDKESETIVQELWFCHVKECNNPGIGTFSGLRWHVKHKHADLSKTYDFDLDVSPTVREIKDKDKASLLADYAAEARRVASLKPEVVERKSVFYCAARENGCQYRHPIELSVVTDRPRVKFDLSTHYNTCEHRDKKWQPWNAIVGWIVVKATLVDLYICEHPGYDFESEDALAFHPHLQSIHAYGIGLLRAKGPVKRKQVVRMVEGDWKYEGPMEEPVERRWVELLSSCAECGTTERSHGSLGPTGPRTLCIPCHTRWWKREKKRLAALGQKITAHVYARDHIKWGQFGREEDKENVKPEED